MLFRPNFCANCGEKIERAHWGIFTSRRFCPVCESVHKGQDLIPRIVVGLGVVIGLFGIGGYLNSGSRAPETQFAREPKKLAEQAMPAAQAAAKGVSANEVTVGKNAVSAASETQDPPASRKVEPRMQGAPMPQLETAVDQYFCGAETKKGTPCKHRVKGNIRCFQHAGMPAMLPPDKLRIN